MLVLEALGRLPGSTWEADVARKCVGCDPNAHMVTLQVLSCLSRDPLDRPSAVQLLYAWQNIFDHVQTHGADWGSSASDAARSSSATARPVASGSTQPSTHTHSRSGTQPTGESGGTTAQSDARPQQPSTASNVQNNPQAAQNTDGGVVPRSGRPAGETAVQELSQSAPRTRPGYPGSTLPTYEVHQGMFTCILSCLAQHIPSLAVVEVY